MQVVGIEGSAKKFVLSVTILKEKERLINWAKQDNLPRVLNVIS